MAQSIRWWLLFSILFTWVLAACGSDDPIEKATHTGGAAGAGGADGGGQGGSAGVSGSGGTGAVGGCTVLTPMDTTLYFGSVAFFAVSASVDAPLAGYAKTRLAIELYDEGSGLPAGTFDLAQAPDDSYATCEHCVLLVAYD